MCERQTKMLRRARWWVRAARQARGAHHRVGVFRKGSFFSSLSNFVEESKKSTFIPLNITRNFLFRPKNSE